MTEPKPNRWKSVTIGTMLFLVFCSAGFFAGYRYGASIGSEELLAAQLQNRAQIQAQVQAQLNSRDSQLVTVVYDLRHQTEKQAGLKELHVRGVIVGIKKAVNVGRWRDFGGPCLMRVSPPARVIVSGTEPDHERIRAYLRGWSDSSLWSSEE